ncbi:hypothetical protein F4803DRAFT_555891 [Xylaria telfairii]|nr:hypothetical protein F4803DRAFT_555891 [Xylaria telfairii]
MHHYRKFMTFVLTLSAVFLEAALAIVDAPNSALASHSSRNDIPGSTLEHGLGNDDYDGSIDDDLEDDNNSKGAFNPIETIYPNPWLNNTSFAFDQKKKSLPVKKITCSGLTAGRNITVAVNTFVDWGETYLVGKRNWHWAGIGGYGEYAIVWMCNCNWVKNQPVNCWELNEALQLLEDKCGPGQGGIVHLHGGREIGLGPKRRLDDVTENNHDASLCRHKYCYYPYKGALTQCGRGHPLNKDHLGEGCRVPDEQA